MSSISYWLRDALGDLWASRKWRTAALGLVVGLAAKLGLHMDAESLALILSPLVAYIVGQGVADMGKEAAAAHASAAVNAEDQAYRVDFLETALVDLQQRADDLQARLDASMEDDADVTGRA